MNCAILVLVLVTALSSANPTPSATEITSPRSATEIGETIKQLTNQLMEANATTSEIMMDTRTPPKIKQHAKKKPNNNKPPQVDFESSHAGVAIPIDEDDLAEETTKKLSFYKIERPTTNSGLSTWILLSGQTTPKPSKKPVVKPNENQNATLMVEPNKVIKPIFKKRVSTTRKPTTPRTTRTTTEATPKTTKLNKIKASILNNAKKTTVAPSSIAPKKNTTTTIITSKKTTVTVSTSATTPKTATATTLKTTNATLPTNSSSSSTLPLEAKEGETELEKTKRPSTTSKRKKNKNRRRRPESKNATKIEKSSNNKHKTKENPISTQFYNYLQREVMPTVGVGLVGLMVTAGLASYFLYPFGAARRSYDIDRKDKEGTYYYSDQYSGGIAEEEAIGKVIAGMPENSLYSTYKTPSSRKSFSNRQVNINHRAETTVNDYNSYQPVTYNSNKENSNNVEKETAFTTVDDRKFVVGNAPKEADVTPAAVPEHGPRSLRIRRETKIPEDEENEIEDQQLEDDAEEATTVAVEEPATTTTTEKPEDSAVKVVELFRDLVHFKLNAGLRLVQRAADAISKFASEVQGAVDEHYKNTTMKNKDVKLS